MSGKSTKGANAGGRRQQMLVTAMAVTAIVAIVTVVVGPWRGSNNMTDVSDNSGSPELLVPRPPQPDLDRPHLIVSPASVPAEGGEVALILANPGTGTVDFGVSGMLQRWDGSAWSNHRQFTTGLGPDRPAGHLHGLDEQIMIPMIALTAEPRGFGTPVRTRVEGVRPGWYLFQQGEASGLLEVGRASGDVPARPTTPFALEGNSVVQSGIASTLALQPTPREPISGSFEPEKQIGRYTGDARIERWDDGRWVVVPSDLVATVEGDEGAAAFSVKLPALETGVHRVSREASVAGRSESLFWVLPLSDAG